MDRSAVPVVSLERPSVRPTKYGEQWELSYDVDVDGGPVSDLTVSLDHPALRTDFPGRLPSGTLRPGRRQRVHITVSSTDRGTLGPGELVVQFRDVRAGLVYRESIDIEVEMGGSPQLRLGGMTIQAERRVPSEPSHGRSITQPPVEVAQIIRTFVASPGDVGPERSRVHRVASELNLPGGLAEQHGCVVKVLDWNEVSSGGGRPEDVVLEQLAVTSWDVFVGIFWNRFGSSTGGVDPSTGSAYESGTEEEFWLAYHAWEIARRPFILFFHKTAGPGRRTIDQQQIGRVHAFLRDFEPKGKHPGLVQPFVSPNDFEMHLRVAMTRYLPQLVRDARRSRDDQVPVLPPPTGHLMVEVIPHPGVEGTIEVINRGPRAHFFANARILDASQRINPFETRPYTVNWLEGSIAPKELGTDEAGVLEVAYTVRVIPDGSLHELRLRELRSPTGRQDIDSWRWSYGQDIPQVLIELSLQSESRSFSPYKGRFLVGPRSTSGGVAIQQTDLDHFS